MSNLQPNCCLKFDFQKVDQHAGGKWLIHNTKRRKDNQFIDLIDLMVCISHHFVTHSWVHLLQITKLLIFMWPQYQITWDDFLGENTLKLRQSSHLVYLCLFNATSVTYKVIVAKRNANTRCMFFDPVNSRCSKVTRMKQRHQLVQQPWITWILQRRVKLLKIRWDDDDTN